MIDLVSSLVIRHARHGDAAALSRFAERVFRQTFGPDNSAADMDAYCRASFGDDLQRAEIAAPENGILVVEEAGTMVAYAQLRSRTPPACVIGPDPIQLVRFYIDPAHHGNGLAQMF